MDSFLFLIISSQSTGHTSVSCFDCLLLKPLFLSLLSFYKQVILVFIFGFDAALTFLFWRHCGMQDLSSLTGD